MKTKTTVKKVSELIEKREDPPLPLSVIPNYMGINLCSVDSIEWVEQEDDGQLVSLTIHFIPATEEERAGRDFRPAVGANTGAVVRCAECDGAGEVPGGARCEECGGKGCVCAVCTSTSAPTPHVRASS